MKANDDELLRRIDELDAKLDQIKTDVAAVSHITKHQSKAELQRHFWAMLKGSLPMQRIWWVLGEYKTQEEIASQGRVPRGSVGSYVMRLEDRNVLHKVTKGKLVRYRRADMTEGLGLERLIQQAHQAANEKLPL